MTPRKPAKKSTSESENRRTNVLLEEIRASLSVLADGLKAVRAKVDTMERRAPTVQEDVELIKAIVRQNTDELARIKSELSTLTSFAVDHSKRFEAVELQFKLVRDDVKTFTKRLETVEARLIA